MKTVKLTDIRLDGGTQMRVSIDQDKVKEYANLMREGVQFDAISTVFDGTTHWLVDGFHRYFAAQAASLTALEVTYKPGTLEDAQDIALGANSKHGLPRTNKDKRKAVETAISMERHKDKPHAQIAQLCAVSETFVAAVRNPKTKERQAANVAKHFEKKASEQAAVKLADDVEPAPPATKDYGPSEEELKANELAEQAERETFNKMLEADDKLAAAYEEIKKLQFLNAQQQVRIDVLMTEKNEAIKDAKRAQSQLDKLLKAKK
jgi:ParB-like chromosome segregation protein Spo0J